MSRLAEGLLYDTPEWIILLVLLGLLCIAGESGHRLGRRKKMEAPEMVRTQASGVQSAFLGLFALLLGFTFAMALSRFDLRKEMIVREANAIGTASLRARLLPEPQRARVGALFLGYIENRVASGRAPTTHTPRQEELAAEASRLQGELWREASAAAEADPRSVPLGLLLQAVNEVIDVKEERDAALANTVPEAVLALLFVFAIVASAFMGYGNGLAGVRTLQTTTIFIILIALVIGVIIDLDRPRRGLIRDSHQSMTDLQKSHAAFLGADQQLLGQSR